MPRKTRVLERIESAFQSGFNEAAARCRGKQAQVAEVAGLLDAASMRPRPDAAENGLRRRHRRRHEGASMRPRPDAAENVTDPWWSVHAPPLQ